MTESNDVVVLNTRMTQVQNLIDLQDQPTNVKTFRKYFDNKLAPMLDAYIIKSSINVKITPNWTNKILESANHIWKSAVLWKASDLPKFITISYGIVSGEEIERERTIRETRNFKLAPTFQHLYEDIDNLTDISQEQREHIVKKFRTDKGKSKPNIVTSKDGTPSCQVTPSAGKKKNQLKKKTNSKNNNIVC